MIVKLRDAEIVGMQAVTELRDDFGNRHLVHTQLNVAGADHAGDVTHWIEVLTTNENNFVANLEKMGKSQAEIDTLKVKA